MRTTRLVAVLAGLVLTVTGCSGGDDGTETGSVGDLTAATDGSCLAGDDTGAPVTSEAVEVVDPATGVRVEAVEYEAPCGGDPWSQWGQGLALADGRFLSAVGDHRGTDGNSWLYVLEGTTLTRVTDVASVTGHQPGSTGPGKVHARMVQAPDGAIFFTTFWGDRAEAQEAFEGDHLVRIDPSGDLEDLGVPVAGHGLPSLAISPDGRHLFVEAVDPASEPDSGPFVVLDPTDGSIVAEVDGPHVGFRAIAVTADGTAMFSAGDAVLRTWHPDDGAVARLDVPLPGERLRATTPPAPDGTVFGATTKPDALFALRPDGTIDDLGELASDVASLGMAPDGSELYFVPGAHGDAAERQTPLMALDVATGERRIVVELRPLLKEALGVEAGGSYDVVVATDGKRVHVGLNAGDRGSAERFGRVVLATVHLP